MTMSRSSALLTALLLPLLPLCLTSAVSPAQAPSAPCTSTSSVASQESACQKAVSLNADTDDGIKVKDARKNVLFGNARRSKAPSIVDYKKALSATPEARKIKDEGIDKNSAQYAILLQKAVKRLKKVIRSVAIAEGRDCVVKKGSVRSKGDADIADITSQVVSELESSDLD